MDLSGGAVPVASSGDATALATTTTSVDISASPAPGIGYELIAISSIAAIWRNPLSLNALLFTSGTDTENIQEAIDTAVTLGISSITIPRKDVSNSAWLLDSAILLPSNMTVYLEGCYLKLSDTCRDNFFRSDNVGYGITSPVATENIRIIGIGNPLLEGADIPRATGDNAKTLSLTPSTTWSTYSYGSDTGVAGQTQKGDWRNFAILFALVTNFSIENIKIKDSHCWAIVCERCDKGIIDKIEFDMTGAINGHPSRNQDGVDLRLGCHDITISRLTGRTGDDFVALTTDAGSTTAAGAYGVTNISNDTPRANNADDIRNINISDLNGYAYSLGNGAGLVRLYDAGAFGTSPGYVSIYKISISNIKDTLAYGAAEPYIAIRIGNPTYSIYNYMRDITITNVVTHATNAIVVYGGLVRASISNIIKISTTNANSAYYENATFLGSANVKTSNLVPS